MQWKGRRESSNVDDQRGGGGFGFSGLPARGGIFVIGIIIVISLVTGSNPLTLLQKISVQDPSQTSVSVQPTPEEEELSHFVRVILGSTEDVWHNQMKNYRDPTLVLFTSQINSGCGLADAATGPFYCGEDEKVYIDLSFYRELRDRFNAPGDFAQAYVIAHEVGHHVQHILGITDKVHASKEKLSDVEYNKLSVRLELQADFLAGVWAFYARDVNDFIEEEDFDEAINAASAIGDDRLQRRSIGRVTPDSFTHGTSDQRVRWFTKGFKSGDIQQGDTFSVADAEL